MKIGYACINRSIGCTANTTFRLKNYSEQRLIETVSHNLDCLQKILEFNVAHELNFFRISSDLIPFASHPICSFDWAEYFGDHLLAIGNYIKENDLRISMHPDQFVLINALNEDIVKKSIADLIWHCRFLDALGLDHSAKVQIHVGGAYGDKTAAIKRFIQNYKKLSAEIKARLVIENDDRIFNLSDCLIIHQETGIPIIFDNLHHECNHLGESLPAAIAQAAQTWSAKDGILMCDYSSQEPNARMGKHAATIDETHFSHYLKSITAIDCDIMLEIKDKENSALKAIEIARK